MSRLLCFAVFMIVLVVLVVLTTAFPRNAKHRDEARKKTTQSAFRVLEHVVYLYLAETGQIPRELSDLQRFFPASSLSQERPSYFTPHTWSLGTETLRRGVDLWGNPLNFEVVTNVENRSDPAVILIFRSAGADGSFGTHDDVISNLEVDGVHN